MWRARAVRICTMYRCGDEPVVFLKSRTKCGLLGLTLAASAESEMSPARSLSIRSNRWDHCHRLGCPRSPADAGA